MSAHETHILTVGCVFICDFEFSKKTWVNKYSMHMNGARAPMFFRFHVHAYF